VVVKQNNMPKQKSKILMRFFMFYLFITVALGSNFLSLQ